MAKLRIEVDPNLAARILVASDRTCCVCNFSWLSVQIHHIDDDPSNNNEDNLAILCLECHGKTQIHGGFGRRLDASQVREYKMQWVERVQSRRAEVDKLFINAIKGANEKTMTVDKPTSPILPSQTGLLVTIKSLPILKRLAFEEEGDKLQGTTVDIVQSTNRIIDTFETAMVQLASYYPQCHFTNGDSREYFSEVRSQRSHWHYYISSSQGVGSSGTIVQILTARGVLKDMDNMIEQMVDSLWWEDMPAHELWQREWRAAGE